MDNIKCSYCGSEDVEYHEYYGTYTCKGCDRILGEDEVISDEPQEVDTNVDIVEHGKDLRPTALCLLNLLMFIPIVDLLVTVLVNKSDAKDSYKRMFSYRYTCSLLVFGCLLVTGILWLYNLRTAIRIDLADKVVWYLSVTDMDSRLSDDLLVPDGVDYLDAVVADREPVEVVDEYSPNWEDMNGVVVIGEYATTLVRHVNENAMCFIQTDTIRDRYGEETYRNIGMLADGSERQSSTGAYFYKGEIGDSCTAYTDDYGQLVYMDIDDIYNKRYIYYIDPKEYFSLRVICNDDGSVRILSLQEVDVEK